LEVLLVVYKAAKSRGDSTIPPAIHKKRTAEVKRAAIVVNMDALPMAYRNTHPCHGALRGKAPVVQRAKNVSVIVAPIRVSVLLFLQHGKMMVNN